MAEESTPVPEEITPVQKKNICTGRKLLSLRMLLFSRMITWLCRVLISPWPGENLYT